MSLYLFCNILSGVIYSQCLRFIGLNKHQNIILTIRDILIAWDWANIVVNAQIKFWKIHWLWAPISVTWNQVAVAIRGIPPSKINRKLKSHETLFACNLSHRCPIILKFCTEHGSGTAMLCAKFQNDRATEMYVVDEWDLLTFEFGWDILYWTRTPWTAVIYNGPLHLAHK